MNLKKFIINQAGQIRTHCLIIFLLIIFCGVRVFYVNAAEIVLEKENKKNGIWGAENKDSEIQTAAFFGNHDVTSRLQEMERIRTANEDGIQVTHMMAGGYHLSDKEYGILTRIVEAEAGNMDKKSKILVANVILNRMNHEEFPDTVEEVVFQNVNGAIQFSPVADGRYYTVKITESTKESVDRALAGEDYSEGALYFMERSMSAASNVNWFDTCLTKLFKYQSHEFYK